MRALPKVLLGMAMLLAGCGPMYSVSVYEGADPLTQEPFSGTIRVGEKVPVSVHVSQSDAFLEAISLQTGNIAIVRTEPGGPGFYLYGVAPGRVGIRATTLDNPVADFTVTVVEGPMP
jgi:hypothetical protein